MISCISSQSYNLIIGKCHMHFSVGTDVWEEREAGLGFFFSFGFMSFIDFSRRKGLVFDPFPPAWDKNCWQLPRDE